jgi:hypothetical protein
MMTAKEGDDHGDIMATQIEVASHLFLSDKWVRELLKQGVLPSSSGRGGYDLDKCREAYVTYLRGIKSGQVKGQGEAEPDDIRDAKIKRKVLETKLRKENYQLSVLENKYQPLAVITETLLRVAQSMSIQNESFSAQIKQVWPDMPPEAKEKIDEFVAERANEIADIRPDISDFRESDSEGDSSWLESITDGET